MTTTHDNKIIHELLGTEIARQILREMGLEDISQDEQEKVLASLGRGILQRVLLEILKELPEADHQAVQAYMDTGDMVALRDFVAERIPNLDRFIQQAAMNEYEATKTQMHQIAQGV